MDSPVFLTTAQVLELHQHQIDFFSGGQCKLSDLGLLDSAIAAPINHYIYKGTKNLFDLAACYAFHIVKNHAFVDGNKRTALAATLAFLDANGLRVRIRQKVIYKAMLNLASSKISMQDFSKILSDHSPIEFAFVATLFESKPGRTIGPRR